VLEREFPGESNKSSLLSDKLPESSLLNLGNSCVC
jgi:hypothetical protein